MNKPILVSALAILALTATPVLAQADIQHEQVHFQHGKTSAIKCSAGQPSRFA